MPLFYGTDWGPWGSCLVCRGLALPVNLFFSSPLSLPLFFIFFFFSPFFLLLAAVGCCCCSSDFKKEERENPGARMGKKRKVLHAGGNGKGRVLGLFPPVCVPSWHPLSFSISLSAPPPQTPTPPPSTPSYPVLLKMRIYTWLCWPEGLLGSLCCTGHPHIIFDGVNKWTHVGVILGGSQEYKFRLSPSPPRVLFSRKSAKIGIF